MDSNRENETQDQGMSDGDFLWDRIIGVGILTIVFSIIIALVLGAVMGIYWLMIVLGWWIAIPIVSLVLAIIVVLKDAEW